MPDAAKIRAALLDPSKDYNHRFHDVITFLQSVGWMLRIKGSHRILTCPGNPHLLNLQPEKNGKAKAYQIRQIRQMLLRRNT
jgi:predicted RNA binding protein YcfA (HicA-like mRNA interferase family)